MYDGIVDCGRKIVEAEGLGGLYKGWAANYLRVGPHTVLSLVLWNELRRVFCANQVRGANETRR
jgi:hypothetical protein